MIFIFLTLSAANSFLTQACFYLPFALVIFIEKLLNEPLNLHKYFSTAHQSIIAMISSVADFPFGSHAPFWLFGFPIMRK